MPQCHNFVSGISSFCLQSQNEKLDEKKSCWDCKQSVEVPDTKLWHCDIFFKHSCNLWIKDLKNIWLWIRSVTEGGKFQLDFFLLLEEQVCRRRSTRIRLWPLDSRPFKIAKLYCGSRNSYRPRYLPYGGLRHQIYQYLDMVKYAKIGLILKNRSLVFYGDSNPKNQDILKSIEIPVSLQYIARLFIIWYTDLENRICTFKYYYRTMQNSLI